MHYVPTAFFEKRDCNRRLCTYSALHPRNCKNCTCDIHWYPVRTPLLPSLCPR